MSRRLETRTRLREAQKAALQKEGTLTSLRVMESLGPVLARTVPVQIAWSVHTSDDFCELTNTDRVVRGAPLFLEIALKFDDLLLVAPESKQTLNIDVALTLNGKPVRFAQTLACAELHALLKAMSSGQQMQQQVAVQLHESGKYHIVEAWVEQYVLIRMEVIVTDKDKNMCCIKIKEMLLFKPVQ